jgi:hypothetical protein
MSHKIPEFREFKRHTTKYLLSLQWERIEVRGNKPVMKDCLGNGGVDRSEPRRSR